MNYVGIDWAYGRAAWCAMGETGTIARDVGKLAEYLEQAEIDILVLDPLDHHVDSLSGQSRRQTLGELMLIAERTGTTIVAAHHFNKTGRTIDVAIGGGRGVKGVARSILVWGPEPASQIAVVDDVDGDDDDEERFLLAITNRATVRSPRRSSSGACSGAIPLAVACRSSRRSTALS